MTMTPEQRKLRAQRAVHSRWARPFSREEQAEAARAPYWRHFEGLVDPAGILPPAERRRCAESLSKANAALMRLAKSRGRIDAPAPRSDPPAA